MYCPYYWMTQPSCRNENAHSWWYCGWCQRQKQTATSGSFTGAVERESRHSGSCHKIYNRDTQWCCKFFLYWMYSFSRWIICQDKTENSTRQWYYSFSERYYTSFCIVQLCLFIHLRQLLFNPLSAPDHCVYCVPHHFPLKYGCLVKPLYAISFFTY